MQIVWLTVPNGFPVPLNDVNNDVSKLKTYFPGGFVVDVFFCCSQLITIASFFVGRKDESK